MPSEIRFAGTLARLEAVTVGLLSTFAALERPLYPNEQFSWRWVLEAWDSPHIASELASTDRDRQQRGFAAVVALAHYLDRVPVGDAPMLGAGELRPLRREIDERQQLATELVRGLETVAGELKQIGGHLCCEVQARARAVGGGRATRKRGCKACMGHG